MTGLRMLSVGHKEHNVLFTKSETLLIRSPSGEDFLLEQADEFDREVAALGSSDKFMSFLDARSKEKEEKDIPLSEARSKRGL